MNLIRKIGLWQTGPSITRDIHPGRSKKSMSSGRTLAIKKRNNQKLQGTQKTGRCFSDKEYREREGAAGKQSES
jgi:hypothetical protein